MCVFFLLCIFCCCCIFFVLHSAFVYLFGALFSCLFRPPPSVCVTGQQLRARR
jgi:hypothetical protein